MKKAPIFQIVCGCIAIIGMWILLQSPHLGLNSTSKVWVGSGDSETYSAILQGYINAYRWTGGIMLSAGCLGILIPFKNGIR